jgi:putative ABC transport system substrate-binding protein
MTKTSRTAFLWFRSDNRKSAIQNRKWVGLFAIVVALTVCGARAEAQQAGKNFRIGFLDASTASGSAVLMEAFRQELSTLGWIAGKNITIEYRFADGKFDRLSRLATDLVRLKVELIVVSGGPPALAAKKATTTIPIVMTSAGDPVGTGLVGSLGRPGGNVTGLSSLVPELKEATSTIPVVMGFDIDPIGLGFVASLARPGGNITGLSTLAPEISGKRLELLKETVPKLSRVAVFGNSTFPGNAQALKETEFAARALGVELQYLDTRGPKDFGAAFRAAGKGRADAVLMLVWGAALNPHRKEITELAIKSRLPAIYGDREHVEARGLMSYGVSITDLFRRAATYVDKILKGAKPDLPVEQPTKFELIINLKAAKQIGLTIPPNVLARADRVIK